MYRIGVSAALDAADGIEVVGEATNGLEAIERADELRPDVIVMDLHMPDLTGIEAIQDITKRNPDARILVLTMFEDDDSVFAAMRAGARGYLVKASRPEQIVDAVKAVGQGEAIFSPQVATRLLDFFAATPHPQPTLPELTQREQQIIGLMAQGKGNAAIAKELVLSHKTVRNHVSNIVRKLHVANREQAIAKAREAGL